MRMIRKRVAGLFVAGTDTEVGKTYVTALLARHLAARGLRVGVYKPVASGCRREGDAWVSDDAVTLWQAAGRPGTLEQVCPQCFGLPLAPVEAARGEGRTVDRRLLREGLTPWLKQSDVVLVESAGGLMSPVSEVDFVADLAGEFGWPLLLVARNVLGTIHHTLSAVIVSATFGGGLPLAGIVLNQASEQPDASAATNARQIRAHAEVPLLAEIGWGQTVLPDEVDWPALAQPATRRRPPRVTW